MIYPYMSKKKRKSCPLVMPCTSSIFFFDDAFNGMMAGQLVYHIRSTNSKPQPSNKFPMDKIKSRTTFFLVQKAILLQNSSQQE